MSADLRYPVGPFTRLPHPDAAERAAALDVLDALPAQLAAAVSGLDDAQLDTPYRPGGWTVRQVVHHVPDSHLNAYVRTKLVATENTPSLTTYEEKAWAELADARTRPIQTSLELLTALHARWLIFLRSLDDSTLARTGRHPEWGLISLDELIQQYAWHSRHHVAHNTALRAREHW